MSSQLSSSIKDTYDDDTKRKKSVHLTKIEPLIQDQSLQSLCPALVATEQLIKRSFHVIDDFVSPQEVAVLRAEVEEYYKQGKMQPGEIGNRDMASSGGGSIKKDMRDDVIAWLEGSESFVGTGMRRHILRCDVFSQKIQILCDAMAPKLSWTGAGRTKIMASLYQRGTTGSATEHGARYVAHVDNAHDIGDDLETNPGNGRRLTLLMYLNQKWKAPDGGCLRVKTETEVVDVAPLGGRLVCFWSDNRVPHEVLPAMAKDRYAITIWYMDSVERKAAEKKTAAAVAKAMVK